MSTTLYPAADAYVRQNVPNANYGSATLVNVKETLGSVWRGFVRFDLSTLPDGAVITLATLRLYCHFTEALISGVTDVQARRITDNFTWLENAITWNNQPTAGDVEDTQVPVKDTWMEWDITEYAQDRFAIDKLVTALLRCVIEGYDSISRYSYYRSKEYDSFDPELYIEYTIPSREMLGDGLASVTS